jgi:hypothetical protein
MGVEIAGGLGNLLQGIGAQGVEPFRPCQGEAASLAVDADLEGLEFSYLHRSSPWGAVGEGKGVKGVKGEGGSVEGVA